MNEWMPSCYPCSRSCVRPLQAHVKRQHPSKQQLNLCYSWLLTGRSAWLLGWGCASFFVRSYRFKFYFICWVSACHAVDLEVKGQVRRVGSLLPSRGSKEQKAALKLHKQLPDGVSHRLYSIIYLCFIGYLIFHFMGCKGLPQPQKH